jgi:hypothetical protein
MDIEVERMLVFEGRITATQIDWLVEFAFGEIRIAGATRKEALEATRALIESEGRAQGVRVDVEAAGERVFVTPRELKPFIAYALRRSRQCRGLSLRQAARELGFQNHNALAAYEQGRRHPSVAKFIEMTRQLLGVDPVLGLRESRAKESQNVHI